MFSFCRLERQLFKVKKNGTELGQASFKLEATVEVKAKVGVKGVV